MTYEEAQERATLVVHGIHEGLKDKDDKDAFRAALRARLETDAQFNADCRLCGLMTLESWQATRH
jgi:hypothetical protein